MRLVLLSCLMLALPALTLADALVPMVRCAPARDVQVTMYAGSDRALVREVSSVDLAAGQTELRFHWTDADIDDSSVALTGPDGVTVGGVRQVPEEPKTFIWPVTAQEAGVRQFTASYFLRGLHWSPVYYLTVDAVSGKARLVGKLHLTNDSRYPLRGVHLSLCAAATSVLDKTTGQASLGTYAALEDCTLEPGWQRRVTFLDTRDVPARVVYRADWETSRTELRRWVLLDLRKIAVPGTLPKGHLEVSEVLGGKRLPVTGGDLDQQADKDTEIPLGAERDVVYERTLLSTRKTDVEFDKIGRVSGFDTSDETSAVFRNRLPQAVHIEVIERVPGKWDLVTKVAPVKQDPNEVHWEMDLQPNQRAEMQFTAVRHTGTRAK